MIYIVPDSNFLHIPFDKSRTTLYSRFYLNQPFEELINLRDLDTCNDIVQILVPEMVLRELIEQKITQYEKDIATYSMLALRMGKPKEEFESVSLYRNEVLKQAKDFLNTKSVDLIPVCDAKYWNSIVDKAIRKDIENIVFYILDGVVHIVFNEYELGPYASGIIDLILCDCKY